MSVKLICCHVQFGATTKQGSVLSLCEDPHRLVRHWHFLPSICMALCRIGGSIVLRAKQVTDESAQRELADEATERRLTHAQAKSAVKQRKGKPAPKSRGFKQTFFAENGIKDTVSAPKKVTYHEVAESLTQTIEEVRHYIDQGRTAF